ncbi:MAG: 4-(cytidine 5'-diphospho)-2-C-methyl-D-erythritol kinase [Ignavibacteriae bacterium]|nr:4-(cytidine 5'-diphospho)-2-C-methyl-D-erythritol kinase [Ignavibacteriota bacterium]NOG96535.1 4-(cytidine 5'-diphospho)-2-C-methyl-D-erythritol kinase [Ignavibacteriota bacterium]
MKSIQIKAPAKINIGLSITSKRDDGFHNLETLFYPIHDLFDMLKFEVDSHFSFKSNDPALTDDESNLIVRAKQILEKVTNKKLSVKIYLQKNIPSGAGLGGGSSDAATTLVCLNEMFNLGLNFDTLANLALELGSDVPFFLRAKPAIGKSRGEKLTLIDLEITKPIMIVNPNIHVSTKDAFSNIVPSKPKFSYENLVPRINDFSFLKENVKNDFEENLFKLFPEIESLKNMFYANGAEFALMTGTGSTVFGIFNSLQDAESAKEIIPNEFFTFISVL